jgi:hypothetical protein
VDVYSFAIVAWEVVERRVPYETNSDFPPAPLLSLAYIRDGGRPKFGGGGDEIGEAVVALIRRCWVEVPEERPPFAAIYAELSELLAQRGEVPFDERDMSLSVSSNTVEMLPMTGDAHRS